MTDDEARAFLSSLINYEQQTPSATDLALQPIRDLLAELGNPHQRLAVVHVAGTNGKGSLAAMTDEVLRQAGYRTGLYTSPALRFFEERIRVAGVPISAPALTDHLSLVRDRITSDGFRRARRAPSYFDVATAIAFRHFEQSRVDVAVVEVGLGGRNDSTNVCQPVLSVITSIGYDHTAQLGPTLGSIAAEKAGVIKPGRPCVSGVADGDAREVVARACAERHSPLSQLGVDFSYSYVPARWSGSTLRPARVSVTTRHREWGAMELRPLGEHQAANAALAVAAVEQLRALGYHIPDAAVRDGLARVRCPARVEVVMRRPLVVLDCCHNLASAHALVATLTQSFPEHMGNDRIRRARRVLVFGASRDKDLSGLLAALAPHFDHLHLTSYKRSRRSATKNELVTALLAGAPDRSWSYSPTVSEAFLAASAGAGADDIVCVTGSVFLAGEFLSAHGGQLSETGGLT